MAIINEKNKFFDGNGYKMYMDRAFASLILASTKCGRDAADEFYRKYRQGGNSPQYLAEYFSSKTGIDRDLIKSYLENREDGYYERAYIIQLANGDRIFRMCAGWSLYGNSAEDTSFQPISGAQKQLKVNARESLMGRVKGIMGAGYIDEMAFSMNIMYLGATVLGVNDVAVIEQMLRGEEPELPEPEFPMGAEPDKKERIVEKVIVKTESTPLEDMLKAAVSGMVAQVAVDDMVPRIKQRIIDEFGIEPVKHQVIDVRGVKHDVHGIVHEAFDSVCHFVQNDVPIMLYGPAGSGKGFLCEQVATALGLKYYFMNSVTEEFKINGFIDVNGVYHPSKFYEAFTNGGLFFLDEIDASAPEVLVCLNAAIANRYFTFPNGDFVTAHENFRVVAAGNTLGTGADAAYTGRMQLDAASLNRFVVVPIDYDENIDRLSAQGDEELVSFARAYRKAAKKVGLATICSYRNISQIKVAEPAMALNKALLFCLTKEMNKDDLNIMVQEMGHSISGNKYLAAMREIEPMV